MTETVLGEEGCNEAAEEFKRLVRKSSAVNVNCWVETEWPIEGIWISDTVSLWGEFGMTAENHV